VVYAMPDARVQGPRRRGEAQPDRLAALEQLDEQVVGPAALRHERVVPGRGERAVVAEIARSAVDQ